MSRLYIGMTDCYKMAQMYQKQIELRLERPVTLMVVERVMIHIK